MDSALHRYERLLAELERRGRRRHLEAARGADFSSNDYLGLAGSPELRQAVTEALERGVPVGARASRLLRGNHEEHEALEAEAARFFGAERALYFSSGFLANYALWSLLPDKSDLVVHDALIHSSCREGMRAGMAQFVEAAHNDAGAYEEAIRRWRKAGGKGTPWISCESLYSMDGDTAPLEDFRAIAERHGAMLVIDEAHATGVFGRDGRGLASELERAPNVILLHTCGKALGTQGALVCAPAATIEFLVNRSRPFIYSTGPSPLVAAATRAALRIVERDAARRERLQRLVQIANDEVRSFCHLETPGTQIVPVIVGSPARAMSLARLLQARGYDVRGIRPPTVPEGTARLRLSITLNVDEATLRAMIGALAEELTALPA